MFFDSIRLVLFKKRLSSVWDRIQTIALRRKLRRPQSFNWPNFDSSNSWKRRGVLRGGIQNSETSVQALFLLLSQNPKRACSQASNIRYCVLSVGHDKFDIFSVPVSRDISHCNITWGSLLTEIDGKTRFCSRLYLTFWLVTGATSRMAHLEKIGHFF